MHVLCCEGVGEGNKKKTGAKKNKRDRKTREKGKENKENQERIDDGLLRGEKPKEVSRILNAQKLNKIYINIINQLMVFINYIQDSSICLSRFYTFHLQFRK